MGDPIGEEHNMQIAAGSRNTTTLYVAKLYEKFDDGVVVTNIELRNVCPTDRHHPRRSTT